MGISSRTLSPHNENPIIKSLSRSGLGVHIRAVPNADFFAITVSELDRLKARAE